MTAHAVYTFVVACVMSFCNVKSCEINVSFRYHEEQEVCDGFCWYVGCWRASGGICFLLKHLFLFFYPPKTPCFITRSRTPAILLLLSKHFQLISAWKLCVLGLSNIYGLDMTYVNLVFPTGWLIHEIVYLTGLFLLIPLTYLKLDWIHFGTVKILYMILQHSCREREVVVKCCVRNFSNLV